MRAFVGSARVTLALLFVLVAGGPLHRTVQRTLEEVKAQRKLGYRKIVLAGQSFGGYVTLDAADEAPDIFAAVALAPGVRAGSATGRLDASITDRLLQSAKTRSEEHTSELQSRLHLVCRLLLEKKKNTCSLDYHGLTPMN